MDHLLLKSTAKKCVLQAHKEDLDPKLLDRDAEELLLIRTVLLTFRLEQEYMYIFDQNMN